MDDSNSLEPPFALCTYNGHTFSGLLASGCKYTVMSEKLYLDLGLKPMDGLITKQNFKFKYVVAYNNIFDEINLNVLYKVNLSFGMKMDCSNWELYRGKFNNKSQSITVYIVKERILHPRHSFIIGSDFFQYKNIILALKSKKNPTTKNECDCSLYYYAIIIIYFFCICLIFTLLIIGLVRGINCPTIKISE